MDATLAGMKRAGLKTKLIADRLKLPLTAVQDRARKLGAYAHLNHRQGPPMPMRETTWRNDVSIEESDETLLKGA